MEIDKSIISQYTQAVLSKVCEDLPNTGDCEIKFLKADLCTLKSKVDRDYPSHISECDIRDEIIEICCEFSECDKSVVSKMEDLLEFYECMLDWIFVESDLTIKNVICL